MGATTRRRTPPLERLTPRERAVVRSCATPERVQRWLRQLPYNWETRRPTLRSFRGVVRVGQAHCLEAVLAAAAVLDHHGYPPWVLDLESEDGLDHVVFVFRKDGRWGAVAKSRDAGLHGRRPVFRTLRDLVYSYVDPYVDGSGRIVGYGLADLDELVRVDWRLSEDDVWEVEQALLRMPHKRLHTSDRRHREVLQRYLRWKERGGPLDRRALRELYGQAVDAWW
ncbi:MAG: hypothetical protein QN165_04455 [Armatimonadota bacterium]|nr:hypothetical protein [Armatimonadota bacterium]